MVCEVSVFQGVLPVNHREVRSDTGVGKEWLLRGQKVPKMNSNLALALNISSFLLSLKV